VQDKLSPAAKRSFVELLRRELHGHAVGGHEEGEPAGLPGTGGAHPAADAHEAAAPTQRRLAHLLLQLGLPLRTPRPAGAPGAHVELEEEEAGGLGVPGLGADVVPADGAEHERGAARRGRRGAATRGRGGGRRRSRADIFSQRRPISDAAARSPSLRPRSGLLGEVPVLAPARGWVQERAYYY
jgi:hypothetical protein